MDDTICTHICDTHVLIGGIHLEATERFMLDNNGERDVSEDLTICWF